MEKFRQFPKVKQKSKCIRNSYKWEVGGNRKTNKHTKEQTPQTTPKKTNAKKPYTQNTKQTKKDKVNLTH